MTHLLAEFADETEKKGGEFFTPREIVRLLVNLVEPKAQNAKESDSRPENRVAFGT